MEEVYALYKKNYGHDTLIRLFKEENDAINEELYLSNEYPEDTFYVIPMDLF